jgi:hypothetical protein
MPSLSDVRVLLTGDDEADLAVVRSTLPAPSEVAVGLGAAVSAMRLREFGVLVADVSAAQDALALLRAARRSRPAARGIVLMPAHMPSDAAGWELVGRAAFKLIQHPVDVGALATLIDEARRDYLAELAGRGRWTFARGIRSEPGPEGVEVPDSGDARWLLAERRLVAVLRRTVTQWATGPRDDMEDALLRGVGAVAEATREAQGSPEVLIAIAEALGERQRTGEHTEGRSEGEHEAA